METVKDKYYKILICFISFTSNTGPVTWSTKHSIYFYESDPEGSLISDLTLYSLCVFMSFLLCPSKILTNYILITFSVLLNIFTEKKTLP